MSATAAMAAQASSIRVFAQHSYMNCFFIDKSLMLQKSLGEFMFESRYVTVDPLYDKFSITKPIEVIMITNNK